MSPYRASLPVVVPMRVFCKDCRHLRKEYAGDFCVAPCGDSDPVTGKSSARVRNAKLDCDGFTPKRWRLFG